MRAVLILLLALGILPCAALERKQARRKPKAQAAERPDYVDGMRILTYEEL